MRLNSDEIFVYGGFNGYFEALGDAWIINIKNLTCSQILGDKLEKRLWHTAVIVEKTKEIYIFGGCHTNFANNTPETPELPVHILKISVNPKSLKQYDHLCKRGTKTVRHFSFSVIKRKCIDLICSRFEQFETVLQLKKVLPIDLRQHILAISTGKWKFQKRKRLDGSS